MPGVLVLQCSWFLNDFMTAVAFAGLFVGFPAAIGFIPAFISLAWESYRPSRIVKLAPHPIIFWLAYPLIYLATGAGYWITWFYGGQYCDQWFPLMFLLFFLVPYSLWPWFPFVWGGRWGFLVAAIMHFVVVILAGVSLAINIIFFGQMVVIMCIIHAVIALWFLYMALVWILMARCAPSTNAWAGIKQALMKLRGVADGQCPEGGTFGVEGIGKPMDYTSVFKNA